VKIAECGFRIADWRETTARLFQSAFRNPKSAIQKVANAGWEYMVKRFDAKKLFENSRMTDFCLVSLRN
jgi:hypothetical protein